MAGSVCTLVVAGPTGRVALRVPPSVTVADLLSEAIASVGGDLDTTTPWLLAQPKGDALDPERTVGQLGLVDGSLLVLRPAVAAEDETISEDLPEAVAAVVESTRGQWSANDVGTLGAAVAALSVLAAGAAVSQVATPVERVAAAAGVGLVALAFGAFASRFEVLARLGRWVALASLPLWAMAGAAASASFPAGIPAAAAVGILVGALVVWFAVEGARSQAAGVALAAAVFGIGDAVTVPSKLPADVAAGIVAVLALALVGMLPSFSVQMAGILDIDSARKGAKRDLEWSVAAGRDVLAWLILGDAVVLAGATAVLAAGASPYAPALAGVVALATILQARHHGFLAEAAALAVAALVGLGVLEAALAVRLVPDQWLPVAASSIALADAVAAVLAVLIASRFKSSVDSRRWFGLLEFIANAAVIPLLLGVVGLYDFVFSQAKHLL